MALQNRVTPRGELIETTARGTMMGNRGILHDDYRRIVRTSRSRAWLICVLDFKGRRREVMSPGSYTELFFLDEATALSAGHRPCAECRRPAFTEFTHRWADAFELGGRPLAPEVDRTLATERGTTRTTACPPTGTFVLHSGAPHLVFGDRLLQWTPAGYATSAPVEPRLYDVITPASTLAVLRAGYVPLLHPSTTVAAGPVDR